MEKGKRTIDPEMLGFVKGKVEGLLRSTGRKGVEELISFMDTNGYYTAHCGRHHRFGGGMSQHCLEVYMYMKNHNSIGMPMDSLIIVALLHDLCDIKYCRDIEHGHHGYRSVRLLQTQVPEFDLHEDERKLINWHLGRINAGGDLRKEALAVHDTPEWQLLHRADIESAGHQKTRMGLRDMMNNDN